MVFSGYASIEQALNSALFKDGDGPAVCTDTDKTWCISQADFMVSTTHEAKTQKDSVKAELDIPEIELVVGKQLARTVLRSPTELAHRVAKIRRKFAREFGFVIPEIKVSESLTVPSKGYEIHIHGTSAGSHELRVGDYIIVTADADFRRGRHGARRGERFGFGCDCADGIFVTDDDIEYEQGAAHGSNAH